MSKNDALIAKLEKQQKELDKKITAAKKAKAKESAENYQKRCAIIGDAILKKAENDEELDTLIKQILNEQVKQKTHRKMLGLSANINDSKQPDTDSKKGQNETAHNTVETT